MQVTLRIQVPDNAYGDNIVAELVHAWLHTHGTIAIATDNADMTNLRLTYVKEQ